MEEYKTSKSKMPNELLYFAALERRRPALPLAYHPKQRAMWAHLGEQLLVAEWNKEGNHFIATYVYKEGNHCADILANLVLDLNALGV